MKMIDGNTGKKANSHENVQEKLLIKLKDEKYYENIFTWDPKKTCKLNHNDSAAYNDNHFKEILKSLKQQSLWMKFINGLEQFDVFKFYLKLVVVYELYTNGKFDESLKEIKDFVKSMDKIAYDKMNEQYFDAYNHILLSTYAFIATSMKLNNYNEVKYAINYYKIGVPPAVYQTTAYALLYIKELMKMRNIKLVSELNELEKSAIHAIKSLVLMKYPAGSKCVAFKEADIACTLNHDDPEWKHIWLIAKGRMNREFNLFSFPDSKELLVAETLYNNYSGTIWHIMCIVSVFVHFAKFSTNKEEKLKYFKLSCEAMTKAIKLANNDETLILMCLQIAVDHPKPLLSKSIIMENLQKLQNYENDSKFGVFGNYYLRHKKDYKEAKKYFILGKNSDVFCLMKLLKIECLLKPPDEVLLIETLVDALEIFTNIKTKVIILSQILLYCTYYKKDQDKLLDFLKLFMDQPLNDAFKYCRIKSVKPIFNHPEFSQKKFMKLLLNKVKMMIEHFKGSLEEKKIMDNTFERFSKMITYCNERKVNTKTNIDVTVNG